MQARRFGNTDLEVSPICFGPMRFAAKGGADDERSRAGRQALERALERGVNFVHSSYEYGTRWSVGKVLAGHPRRHEIHHVIKVPVPDFDDGGSFDAAKFRLRVEEALSELHTDRIAVIQHLQRAEPNRDELRLPAVAADRRAAPGDVRDAAGRGQGGLPHFVSVHSLPSRRRRSPPGPSPAWLPTTT